MFKKKHLLKAGNLKPARTPPRIKLAITGFCASLAFIPAISSFSAQSEEAATDSFTHVSCRNQPNEIRITIDRVRESVGLMVADLYPNKQEGFLKSAGRLKQIKFAARTPITQFCISAPTSGEYAVAIYHDKNANAKFDKGPLGIPAEPWGISNNPKIRFKAPPVTKTVFSVPEEGTSITIRLRKR